MESRAFQANGEPIHPAEAGRHAQSLAIPGFRARDRLWHLAIACGDLATAPGGDR
jgi:hypothetical protein